MCSLRCTAVAICLTVSVGSAGMALGQDMPSNPDASAAAASPNEAALPPVVVQTKQVPSNSKKKTKKKTAAVSKSSPSQAVAPAEPTADASHVNGEQTAYGAVQSYSAKNTATGIKTDTPLKEIPQSVSVVGTEQMRDQGAQTLSDALRYVPGVVAEAYGLDSRTDGQFIRGTKPAQFLDGLRSNFNEFYYGYRVEPYFMERIEVLRGPSSVLYGQAPVGGIINSVSKRPSDERGGEITFEYGTFDFKQVKFDTTGPISSDGKWSYRVTGVVRNSDTQVDYVGDNRYAIQPSLTWRPDSNTTITVLGSFQKDRTGSTAQFYPHVGTIFPNVDGRYIPRNRFMGEPGNYYDTDVASGTLFIEHKFNSAIKLNHVSRFSDIENKYDLIYPAYWGYLNSEETLLYRYRDTSKGHTQVFNQDTNLEVQFGTGPLSHRILGGIDYASFKASRDIAYYLGAFDFTSPTFGMFDVYNPQYGNASWNAYPCNPCFEKQAIEQTGLYVQDQMRLGNWIGVLGARRDWVDNESNTSGAHHDEAATYRAGLMYEFSSGLTPYVSYGKSFVPVPGISDTGKAFDPQTGRMYEVGFKYQPVGANFAINAAMFDIEETGRLVYGSGTHPKQIGQADVKGFEIELTGQITKNLKITGGYSYTQAEYGKGTTDTASLMPTIDVSGNQIESVPKHLASLWGLWTFDQPELKGWSIGGGVRYIGANWDSSNTLEVPSVTLFDAMLSYETEEWRWQITGRNLADEDYVSTCLYRGDCWLGTARTVISGITYKF